MYPCESDKGNVYTFNLVRVRRGKVHIYPGDREEG